MKAKRVAISLLVVSVCAILFLLFGGKKAPVGCSCVFPTPEFTHKMKAIAQIHAEQGDPTAEYDIGCGAYKSSDGEAAFRWCKKAAEEGYGAAAAGLSDIYKQRAIAKKVGKNAPEWIEAYFWISIFYKPDNDKQRYPLLGEAAAHLDPEIKDKVDSRVANWKPIPIESLLLSKAKTGDAEAQDVLGRLYRMKYSGGVVKTNTIESTIWLHKAADQTYAEAENDLGDFEDDPKEALKWYKKAADQGNPRGQYEVASRYESGLGVAQDYEEAFFWAALAASKNSWFIYGRDSIAKHLSTKQISAVKKRIREWKPKSG